MLLKIGVEVLDAQRDSITTTVENHLHYLTTTIYIYRRARIFDSGEARVGGANRGRWPWSSWPYYYLGDSLILAMDRMP